jgi:hypothetical protein
MASPFCAQNMLPYSVLLFFLRLLKAGQGSIASREVKDKWLLLNKHTQKKVASCDYRYPKDRFLIAPADSCFIF